jgi:hypothetical protein
MEYVRDAPVGEVHCREVIDRLVHRHEHLVNRASIGKRAEFLKGCGLMETEASGSGPHHEVGVPSHPKRIPDVRAQFADIRPLSADDLKKKARSVRIPADQVDPAHRDAAGLQVHDFSATRQVIQAGPFMVDRRHHRRDLKNLPGKSTKDSAQPGAGDGAADHGTLRGGQWLAIRVPGGRPQSQAELDAILLVLFHQELADAGGAP